MKNLFGPKDSKTKVNIKDKDTAYLESNYSTDYLKREQVKQAILDLIKTQRSP